MGTTRLQVITASLASTLAAAASAQADDECAGATPVGVGSSTLANVGYTNSAQPWTCVGAGADRWFAFTPAVTMPYSISACNLAQPLDTVIEVYDGACGQLQFVECDDDSCGFLGLGADARTILNAGRTYVVRVGTLGPPGTFDLAIGPADGALAVSTPSGCGAATLAFAGLPAIGDFLTASIENVTGTPLMGAGLLPANVPACTCVVGHTWSLLVFGADLTIAVPPDPSLRGASLFVQGADLGAAGGCPGLGLALTATWRVTIG